jgi:hypothetical protein
MEKEMPIFVKLNGIDGAIGGERQPATFEIKDFSFGVENPTTIDGDTFDFKPELTSEPTAPAGDGANDPAQMFQQIMQSGPPPDAFDFTSEPTAPEPFEVKMEEVLLSSWNSGDSPGDTKGGDVAIESITLVHEGFDLM